MTEKVNPVLDASWKFALQEEFGKEYFISLKEFLLGEKGKYLVFPPGKLIIISLSIFLFSFSAPR